MKISLVGGSKQARSLPFDAQRTVNLFAVIDEEGADNASLYGTSGFASFATVGSGAIRNVFTSQANSRAFAVSGSELYEIFSNGTSLLRGSLASSSGAITIDENGVQLGICDGNKVYMFTYTTNVFTVVTDLDLPSTAYLSFVDGYFIATESNSGRFFISGLYNGTTWNALDFATAESSPDKLNAAVSFIGYLGLFGDSTLELWRNTGDNDFPFAKVSGSTPVGCIAPDTIQSVDTSVYWVGNNKQGTGIVYQAQGFNPKRISTDAIEIILQKVTQPKDLRSWTYQEEGHVFYVITGADLETSLCYDLATGIWHERAWLSPQGEYEQHRGNCIMYAFGKHLIGDRETGDIYELSLDYYKDGDDFIKRLRVMTHLLDDLKRVRYTQLKLGFETGVGLQTGQGSNPLINLRVSHNGARSWSDLYTKSIGAVGKYQTEVNFRRLGISQQTTFEISTSEPVQIAITGAYLN